MDWSSFVDSLWAFVCKLVRLNSVPLLAAYLVVVVVSLRGVWQRKIRPFELDKALFYFNFVMSAMNVICLVSFAKGIWQSQSIFDKKSNASLSRALLIFWLTKSLELCDTLFLLLRHRFRRISPLHVGHHAFMVLLSELGHSVFPWTAFTPPLLLNCLVQACLYWYYSLTALGEQPVSLKRRITEMQMVQFVADVVFGVYGCLHHRLCLWSPLYGLCMLYIVAQFYRHTYLRAPVRESSSCRRLKTE